MNGFQKVYKSERWNKDFCILVSDGKVHLPSDEGKSCSLHEIELQDEVDELWDFMQIPKKIYSRVKKLVHYEVELKVKNDEGKDSGAL